MNYLMIFCVTLVILQFTIGGTSATSRLFRSAEDEPDSLSTFDDSDDVNNLGDFLNSPQWKELVELLEKLETLGNKEAHEDEDEWRQLLADMESPDFKTKWGIKEDFDVGDEDDSNMYNTPEWRDFMVAMATKEDLADPEFRAKWNIQDESEAVPPVVD